MWTNMGGKVILKQLAISLIELTEKDKLGSFK
jgi:hypothetical protein